jgi:hypothetical protein
LIRRVAVLASAVACVAVATVAPLAWAADPPVSTLFAPDAAPTVPAADDAEAVELGVRFHADVAGTVVGVRFYQGAGNTGTHTGSLWDAAGNRLSTARFPDSTATGWVTAQFTPPVIVKADTTYVASYFAPHGHYAADQDYFVTDRTRGPLTAPREGNGAYVYGASGGFPTDSYKATNYWVDVQFVAAPTTPPSASPSASAGPSSPPASTSPSASAGAPGSSPSHGGGGVGGGDGGESLPITGANVAVFTGGGLLLVAVGVLLFLAARARRAPR